MTIYRCTASGVAFGADSWTFGLHLSKSAGTIDGAMTAFTAYMDKLWNGNGSTVVGISGYYTDHTQVQALVVTALDPVTGKNVEQLQANSTLAGFSTDTELPGEVACCVSLRTALPTRAGRGRFYLPNTVVTTVQAGVFVDSFILDVVEGAQYALDSLVTSTYIPVIYHASTKTGTSITSVDAGNVPDVQRRRRNKLVEARQSLPIS